MSTTQAQNQNWFKHSEAAAYCRISPRTLRRWRAAGRIRHYNGKYFRDDLDQAVRNETFPHAGSATAVFTHPGPTQERHTGTNYVTQVMNAVPGVRKAVQNALDMEIATVRLMAVNGFARDEAEDIVRAARHLSVISDLTIQEALERFSCSCIEREVPDYIDTDSPSMETVLVGDPDRPCPVHTRATPPTPEEITQMDAYADGAAERNGDQFVSDDPMDTERAGWAPGELELVRAQVKEALKPGNDRRVAFGQLDYCPVDPCPFKGQSHDHTADHVQDVVGQ